MSFLGFDAGYGVTMQQLAYTVAGLLMLATIRFFVRLYHVRSMFKRLERDGIPIFPHSFLFGHIPFVIKTAIKNKMPADVVGLQQFTPLIEAYPEVAKYGVIYFDPWPMSFPIAVVIDPEMMSQITNISSSLPKFWSTIWMAFKPFTNNDDLVFAEGREWKEARAIFNPGFSHKNLISLIPQFLEEVQVFRKKLLDVANTGKIVELEPLLTSLTVDVISRAVLGVRLRSQEQPPQLVKAMSEQISTLYFRLDFKKVLNPLRPIMNLWYGRLFRKEALKYIKNLAADEAEVKGPKTVIGLALKSQKDLKGGDAVAASTLDAEKLVNHLKMFMFAGHDSTAVTLAYVYYNLMLKPDILARVRREHEEVFGLDPHKVQDLLLADPSLLNKLPYTFCVLKETLRLFPPFGGTVRAAPESFELVHPGSGKKLSAHGCMLYSAGATACREAQYFRDPIEFIPERWLDSSSATSSKEDAGSPPMVTKAAWRPFEMGPRNCIGQELVFIEVKMVIALTIREFNFEPMYKEGAKTWWGYPGYQCEIPEHPVSARIKDRLPVRITTA